MLAKPLDVLKLPTGAHSSCECRRGAYDPKIPGLRHNSLAFSVLQEVFLHVRNARWTFLHNYSSVVLLKEA